MIDFKWKSWKKMHFDNLTKDTPFVLVYPPIKNQVSPY